MIYFCPTIKIHIPIHAVEMKLNTILWSASEHTDMRAVTSI
jgi:hypothetical protein